MKKLKIGDTIKVNKRIMSKKTFVGKIKDIKQIFGYEQIILEDVHLDDELKIRMENKRKEK